LVPVAVAGPSSIHIWQIWPALPLNFWQDVSAIYKNGARGPHSVPGVMKLVLACQATDRKNSLPAHNRGLWTVF